MKIVQQCIGSSPFGRFSAWHLQDRVFYTVEKPWASNTPYQSCVPLGEYRLLWRPTTTKVPHQFDGHTWYLVGDTVGLEKGEKRRWGCAIHIGNTDEDVEGCIAPGLALGALKSRHSDRARWGVTASTQAMLNLLQLLGPEDHELSINNTLMG